MFLDAVLLACVAGGAETSSESPRTSQQARKPEARTRNRQEPTSRSTRLLELRLYVYLLCFSSRYTVLYSRKITN